MSAQGKFIFILVICLTIFGLIIIGSASIVAANHDFGDKWYYLRQQGLWAFLGLIGMFIAAKYPHQKLQIIARPVFYICLFLLVVVLIPGIGLKILGARRWINLGFTTFQPAEFAKLASILFFASIYKNGPRFIAFAFWTSIITFLLILEPDMGTSIVTVGACTLQYLGSGGKIKYLAYSIPIVVCLAMLAVLLSPYRLSRVKTFLDISHDPQGASYQVRQSIIGVGTGGIIGRGLGQSRQKYEFLPEVTTDSIFAVIGEELGMFGTVAVALSFLGLTLTGLNIASNSKNSFSSSIAIGISSWFGLQSFINMSAVVALLPFTGIPLSFISYGGTSLLVTLIASGILINIANSKS